MALVRTVLVRHYTYGKNMPVEWEIDPTESVGRLKAAHPQMKLRELFYYGAPLADDRSIAFYNIQDDGVIETCSNALWATLLGMVAEKWKNIYKEHPNCGTHCYECNTPYRTKAQKFCDNCNAVRVSNELWLPVFRNISELTNNKGRLAHQPRLIRSLDELLMRQGLGDRVGAEIRDLFNDYLHTDCQGSTDPLVDSKALTKFISRRIPQKVVQARKPRAPRKPAGSTTLMCQVDNCSEPAAFRCLQCVQGGDDRKELQCAGCSREWHRGALEKQHDRVPVVAVSNTVPIVGENFLGDLNYMPQPRCAPMGMLSVLWDASQEVPALDTLGEEELKLRSEARIDSDMFDRDAQRWFSAFDGMEKTLIAKRLCKKEGRETDVGGVRYSLLPAGRDLARGASVFQKVYDAFLQQMRQDLYRPPREFQPTTVADTVSVTLLVDSREPQAERILALARKLDIYAEIRELAMGDFAWIVTGTDHMYPLVVERKTWSDLASSLTDGRFSKQVNRMMRLPSYARFYQVEGDAKRWWALEERSLGQRANRNHMPDKLQHVLDDLMLRNKFRVLYCNGWRRGIDNIFTITRYIQHRVPKNDWPKLSFSYEMNRARDNSLMEIKTEITVAEDMSHQRFLSSVMQRDNGASLGQQLTDTDRRPDERIILLQGVKELYKGTTLRALSKRFLRGEITIAKLSEEMASNQTKLMPPDEISKWILWIQLVLQLRVRPVESAVSKKKFCEEFGDKLKYANMSAVDADLDPELAKKARRRATTVSGARKRTTAKSTSSAPPVPASPATTATPAKESTATATKARAPRTPKMTAARIAAATAVNVDYVPLKPPANTSDALDAILLSMSDSRPLFAVGPPSSQLQPNSASASSPSVSKRASAPSAVKRQREDSDEYDPYSSSLKHTKSTPQDTTYGTRSTQVAKSTLSGPQAAKEVNGELDEDEALRRALEESAAEQEMQYAAAQVGKPASNVYKTPTKPAIPTMVNGDDEPDDAFTPPPLRALGSHSMSASATGTPSTFTATDSRPACQYGLACARKQPTHFVGLKHPANHPMYIAPRGVVSNIASPGYVATSGNVSISPPQAATVTGRGTVITTTTSTMSPAPSNVMPAICATPSKASAKQVEIVILDDSQSPDPPMTVEADNTLDLNASMDSEESTYQPPVDDPAPPSKRLRVDVPVDAIEIFDSQSSVPPIIVPSADFVRLRPVTSAETSTRLEAIRRARSEADTYEAHSERATAAAAAAAATATAASEIPTATATTSSKRTMTCSVCKGEGHRANSKACPQYDAEAMAERKRKRDADKQGTATEAPAVTSASAPAPALASDIAPSVTTALPPATVAPASVPVAPAVASIAAVSLPAAPAALGIPALTPQDLSNPQIAQAYVALLQQLLASKMAQ
eukprot:TRINITY_DN836_c4_g1_i1.p1 TRINITY_DN836_c4_g1~~TRINITY_DN836_c4_g1_i1.p1  ORF type:complete len:1399 (-),score=258.15 TRINITY_DN836_c4_g1_i1:29-4225(-)